MNTPPPPNRPRRDYSIAWILAGVLFLAGALVFTGIWVFSRYLVGHIGVSIRDEQGQGGVAVQTPAGSLEARTGEVSPAELALPPYPNARPTNRQGASVSLDVPLAKNVRVVTAEFETTDPFDRVVEFYRRELGSAAREQRSGDEVRFWQSSEGKQKIVVVRRRAGHTEIAMANITEARTN